MAIFKALAKTYMKEFCWAFGINFIVVLCSISIPFLITLIVDFMQTPSGEDGGIWVGIGLATAYVVVSTGANILNEQAVFWQSVLADQAYGGLVALIYDKTLKVSPSTNKQFEQGEIINFIQVDAERV